MRTIDPRSLVAAEFMILATSLPPEGYPAEEVLAVYRLRWQIELAFKRLKSLLHIDRLPTSTEAASRSWLYAHLIMALLCDDFSQEVLVPWFANTDQFNQRTNRIVAGRVAALASATSPARRPAVRTWSRWLLVGDRGSGH